MNMWLEIILSSVSFSALFIYHVHLVHKVRRDPLSTSIGITNNLRREWIQNVMAEKLDILAVQTLRNWIMAASLLASTAILITLGAVNIAIWPDRLSALSHALNLVGSKNETLWVFKMLLLIVDFFFAFFNFTLAIRYFNHVNFGINVPEKEGSPANHDFMTEVINRGSLHYTMGMRGYYLAIPFALWLFGPTWFLSGTVFLIWVLFKLDRTV
ncbi:MAG: DUF599 domain-containing protein [Desulfobacterales bacterium]|nr:DUF599 domain-containing protein [Desulfobacterales bacterium]